MKAEHKEKRHDAGPGECDGNTLPLEIAESQPRRPRAGVSRLQQGLERYESTEEFFDLRTSAGGFKPEITAVEKQLGSVNLGLAIGRTENAEYRRGTPIRTSVIPVLEFRNWFR